MCRIHLCMTPKYSRFVVNATFLSLWRMTLKEERSPEPTRRLLETQKRVREKYFGSFQ